jgi:uncharacterized protein YbaR (Trm112 family)/trans-aconitate methyltransferase
LKEEAFVMHLSALKHFACPFCRAKLELAGKSQESAGHVKEGTLRCPACGKKYPITNHIVRFLEVEGYASSFGKQWRKFAKTQLDSRTGATISRTRFEEGTGWGSAQLLGQTILEAGCGAGRFSEVMLSRPLASLFSLDYTPAVDVALENLGVRDNWHVCQADLCRPPFQPGGFNKVFCYGVLQHLPAPRSGLASLRGLVEDNGEIAFDIYRLNWRTFTVPRYPLRAFTSRLPTETVINLAQRLVPLIYPVKYRAGRRSRFLGSLLARLLPIADYTNSFAGALDYRQLLELSILDTVDIYATKHDRPQTDHTVRKWLDELGLEPILFKAEGNMIVVKGRAGSPPRPIT